MYVLAVLVDVTTRPTPAANVSPLSVLGNPFIVTVMWKRMNKHLNTYKYSVISLEKIS